MEIYEKKSFKEFGTLRVYDVHSGMDWTRDFIGDCEDLSYDEETERYLMDEDGFMFWQRACRIQQAFDNAFEGAEWEVKDLISKGIGIDGDLSMDIERMEAFLEKTPVRYDDVEGVVKIDPSEIEADDQMDFSFEIQELGAMGYLGPRVVFLDKDQYEAVNAEYGVKE